MNVTVADCLRLPTLREAQLVAGAKGLDRAVSSVSVLEWPETNLLSDELIVGNELVISALVTIKDDVARQCCVLRHLRSMGAAGLVLFYVGVFIPKIDDALIAVADEISLPLIAMPFGRLDFRYSDMITDVVEYMQSASYTIFEVDAHMSELSTSLKKLLAPNFTEYGISLDQFFVTTIAKPDGETAYEKFKDLHIRQYADVAQAELKQKVDIIEQQTQAQKTIIESQAQATKRAQEGYTYQQERGFNVAEKVAENEAVGEFTNLGAGLGTMAGVGGAVGGMVGGMMTDSIASATNTSGDTGMEAFKLKLEKLKLMKESGLLSDEEFNSAKQDLLKSI